MISNMDSVVWQRLSVDLHCPFCILLLLVVNVVLNVYTETSQRKYKKLSYRGPRDAKACQCQRLLKWTWKTGNDSLG